MKYFMIRHQTMLVLSAEDVHILAVLRDKGLFGLTADLRLIVSDRALQLLTKNGVSHAASVTAFH